MRLVIPVVLTVILFSLAALHVYWAVMGVSNGGAFVPESNGRPVFVPTRPATIAVALALLAASYVAATRGGLFSAAPPGSVTHWLAIAAGAVFLLRAVGDFRYVGFFKRRRGTRFATLDSWLFSPLCVVIGGAFVYITTLS